MGNHVNKLLWLFCKLVDSVRQKALGGVYTRKLAPARVSYWDDFLISYRVYIMTGSFHISLFEGTLHVDKIHACPRVIQNRKHYACTSRSSLPADRFHTETCFAFTWYRLPDFVPEWNSRPGTTTGVNSRRGKSSWHDILWRYHVNKCRTMGGNRSKLAPARKSPRC